MTITNTKLALLGFLTLSVAGAAGAQMSRGAYPDQDGQALYEHVCQGCHMPDAKGAAGAGIYPALAANAKLKSGLYPALVVVRGQKAMPNFADLSDAQVAAVVNYVRTHFGNSYADAVTPAQVATLRR